MQFLHFVHAAWPYVLVVKQNNVAIFKIRTDCFLIMTALCSRRGHYIFARRFFNLLSFFLRLISAVADLMSAILGHMVWP